MKLKKEDLRLYAVTDRTWLNGASLYTQVEKALKGGVTAVQLREKFLNKESFVKEALEIKALCKSCGVPFLINDDAEIAKLVDADGVHVGQNDMSVAEVRQYLGKNKIIGVSSHNVQQAITAEKMGADYLGAGAAFPTNSKADTGVIGIDAIKDICNAVSIPVVAIGGINEGNILTLKGSGISGAAVISAIFAQKDIALAAQRLRRLAEEMTANG